MTAPATIDTDDARRMVAFAAAQLTNELTQSFNYDELAATLNYDMPIPLHEHHAHMQHARLVLSVYSNRDLASIGHCAYTLSLYRYGNADRRLYGLCENMLHNRP